MISRGLVCRQLCFQRATQGVLEGIEITFEAGQATLITGETGAGKSTLLHLLGGLLRPSSGEILADGRSVSRWPAPQMDIWRRQVGMVFQHLNLLPGLTVLENIVLPCVPRGSTWHQWTRAARTWANRLGISVLENTLVERISGGQRQRVALARALVCRPDFLLLDEPTSFQDDRNTRCLLTILAETIGQGTCVVVCSHDPRLKTADIFSAVYGLSQGRLEALT